MGYIVSIVPLVEVVKNDKNRLVFILFNTLTQYQLIWVAMNLDSIMCRDVSYSVQNRTGPRTTGSFRSGPRFKKFSFSVFGPVPIRTGGLNKNSGTVVLLNTG